eukprot:355676-Chlamydomonas_euryale.AAC.4
MLSCSCHKGQTGMASHDAAQAENVAASESESELQAAGPIGYACVERSKQSEITCQGSVQKIQGAGRGRPPATPHQTPPHAPPSCHPTFLRRCSSATQFLWT